MLHPNESYLGDDRILTRQEAIALAQSQQARRRVEAFHDPAELPPDALAASTIAEMRRTGARLTPMRRPAAQLLRQSERATMTKRADRGPDTTRGERGMGEGARCRALIEACANGDRSRARSLFEEIMFERTHRLVATKRREIPASIVRDRVVEVSPEDILPGLNNVTLGQAFDIDRWLDQPEARPDDFGDSAKGDSR
jgi:hypothetical protein